MLIIGINISVVNPQPIVGVVNIPITPPPARTGDYSILDYSPDDYNT